MPQMIQRSFTSGEIAPSLRSRADMVKFATGLALCQNFFVRAQGGVYNRPGFRFIGQQLDHTKKGWLIPFSFNAEQTYILVFEHLKMRVIRNGGFVLVGGGGSAEFELVTPYTESQLPRLGFTQDADIMTIVHPDHDPANLSRLADNDWQLETIVYTSTVTAPVISYIGAIGDVAGGGEYDKTYEYVVTTVSNGVESLASSKEDITLKSLSVTYGVRLSWGVVSGADYYRVYKCPSVGTGVYGWIGDSNTNFFDDYNIAPIVSDSPPTERTPFEGSGNKPSVVTYYQDRQVFANTLNEPQVVFTTRVGDFKSFRTSSPARDDDAVTFTIRDRQVNEIRHLVSLGSLVPLTSGAEWKVTEGQDEVLTPATVGVKWQGGNGASWVRPAVINSTAVYLQQKGIRFRDLAYDFSTDKFTGNDLSLMSEHFFEGHQIISMAYSSEPYSILWAVRDDGVLLGLTYQREHQVYGWHQHVTDGEFECVECVTEGSRDAVYVIVKRVINGNTVRYIERFEPRITTDVNDCFFVDSGLTYSGTPVTGVSGLGHLEGKTVAVLADGYTMQNRVVVSGSITLDRPASVVHVGLPYTSVIETLDIDLNAASETLKANFTSVNQLVVEVEGTRGGWVGSLNEFGTVGDMAEIKPRFQSDNYGAIELKSYKQEIMVESNWGRAGGVRIEQRSPLPMAILSVIPRFDTGG